AAWATFVSRHEARISADGRVGDVFDDAYMFVRYADHVLSGQGVAWNAGEGPVHGNTSALYLLEVIGVRALYHGDPGHVAVIGSLLGASAALAAVTWMLAEAGRVAGAPNPPWSWAILSFAALLPWETFRFHAITGMDTMLALACVAAVVAASARV